MIAMASGNPVVADAVSTWATMRSLTLRSGSKPWASTRRRSRSLITPTSLSPSITQAAPVSWSTMRCAASASVVSGVTDRTLVFMRSASSTALTLDQQEQRVLQIPGHGLQQARAVGTRGRAVIDREVDRHQRAHDDLAADAGRALDDAADGEDARLGRVDDRLEARDAEHAEVGDAERAALDLRLAQRA